MTRDAAEIRAFHAEHRDIILKPLDGMGGMGIFRVKDDGLNLGAIIETLNKDGAQTVMVQRYLPAIVDGDKRVLVIGGKPVPHCLARIPKAARCAATWRPAAGAWPGRSPRGTVKLPRPWAPSWPHAACCWWARCDWRHPHRDQCHQPDLLPGDHAAKRF